jgi:hypothetical protein
MKPIVADTCTKAWLAAAEHLQEQADWRDYTLILDISKPMQLPPEDKKVYDLVDRFLADKASVRISTVINTIFPATLFARRGADGIFKEYRGIWPKIKKHARCQQWGTYADRIIQGLPSTRSEKGPLQTLIEKLRKQLKGPAPKRGAYELGTLDSIDEIAIYHDTVDSGRIMGGPCLSHLSFKLTNDRRLMLTALYRSHYYVYRALGNLYGLAWLQHFVATETGIEAANLVCHSTMAKLDTLHASPKYGVKGWGAGDVKTLISNCRLAMNEPRATVGNHKS